MTYFQLLARDYTTPLTIPDLIFKPQRYSWLDQGGPDMATVKGNGPDRAIWEIIEWLGCPVEIYDDQFRKVWWGRLWEITINVGKIKIGLQLKNLSNRVVVVYSYVEPGSTGYGTRATTTYAEDTESVALYGKRELQVSLASATLRQAEMTRDSVLEALHLPTPIVDLGEKDASNGAEFICYGYYKDLDSVYYSQLSGKEVWEEGGKTVTIGNAAAAARAAMSFQITGSTDWEVAMAKIKARKIGSPTDELQLDVRANNAGVPGTLLTTISVPASALTNSAAWISYIYQYTPGIGYVNLTPGTTYWLTAQRSGSFDNVNYYELTASGTVYPRGIMRVWNGSSWIEYEGMASLSFQVLAGKETTRQISDIVTQTGLLVSVQIENRSNVISNQYRRGDTTAWYELVALLKSGTESGRRLLCSITADRELVVWEEPARALESVNIYMTTDGQVIDLWDNPVTIQTCPVGVWALQKNALPSSLDLNRMADPSMFFIEQAEYDVTTRRYLPRVRGSETAWDIASRIVEG